MVHRQTDECADSSSHSFTLSVSLSPLLTCCSPDLIPVAPKQHLQQLSGGYAIKTMEKNGTQKLLVHALSDTARASAAAIEAVETQPPSFRFLIITPLHLNRVCTDSWQMSLHL